jgi:hypothetical protein
LLSAEGCFTMLIYCLVARTVIVSLLLLIGYIYGIWMQFKTDAGKIGYTHDQIWEPFEKARGVFVLMTNRLFLLVSKLSRILSKKTKKDDQ